MSDSPVSCSSPVPVAPYGTWLRLSEEARVICERIGRGADFDDLNTTADEFDLRDDSEDSIKFWTDALAAAKNAERVALMSPEECAAWNAMLASLRRETREFLSAADIFSSMRWEQMLEAEDFELDPETYWTRERERAQMALARHQRKEAERREYEARQAKTVEELKARLARINASSPVPEMYESMWNAMKLGDATCLDPALRAELERLLGIARDSVSFVHTSLSVAEELAAWLGH